MARKDSNRLRWIPLATGISLVLLAVVTVGFTLTDADYFFKINKSIDVFGRVYREVAINYVDEIDPEKFMAAGIDGMLSMLDPYTNFFDEHEGDEIDLITTGKYGGIGVTIGVRDGVITIQTLLDGYSAQRQGLQPGDRILQVDGKPVMSVKLGDVRSMTRGLPGTEVHILVERDGEAEPLEFSLIREEIQLKNITYADFIDQGLVYIRLERFTRSAADELTLAIKELQLRDSIRSIILDLRDNPGGFLDVAVDVVSKFVAKGSLVVSTRGRKPESERKYFSNDDPLLPTTPIVVLVNRNSASASEIVAGAIQDLDRGVILGVRTFGKGLVQTITPLVHNAQLKITVARYYTPSGRSIQELDYTHDGRSTLFSVTPDSLRRSFKTSAGRIEYERGGISPDTVVADSQPNAFTNALMRKSMFYKFATRYASAHSQFPATGLDKDSLLQLFGSFLEVSNFNYETESEKKVAELGEVAGHEKLSDAVRKEIAMLKLSLVEEKKHDLVKNRNEILRTLRPEIVSRFKGERGRIRESLSDDLQVSAARGILLNHLEYSRRLSFGTDSR